MIYCTIIAIVLLVLIIWFIIYTVKRKGAIDGGMAGGAAKKKSTKKPAKKTTKKTTKKSDRVDFPKRKSALTNIQHSSHARYIIIYTGELYPRFVKESGLFKSAIKNTVYKDDAYAVYERPLIGSWLDCTHFLKSAEEFASMVRKEFSNELNNGARLILIGNGYGAYFAKVFKAVLDKDVIISKAIMLNPTRLFEFMPVLIMEYNGIDSIRLGDIEFLPDKCIYKGINYVALLRIPMVLYTIMYYTERMSNDNCYAFFGRPGSSIPDVATYDTVYENTYTVSYGKSFKDTDEWIRKPEILEAALQTVI